MKFTAKQIAECYDYFARFKHDKEYQRLLRQQRQLLHMAVSLAKAREERGLTQAALARKIGMKQSQIARIESGHDNVTLATLTKVASALHKKLLLQ